MKNKLTFVFLDTPCGQGDIVLIGLRDFQTDKADIIHKYTTEDARFLQVCQFNEHIKKKFRHYKNVSSFHEHILMFTFHSWGSMSAV